MVLINATTAEPRRQSCYAYLLRVFCHAQRELDVGGDDPPKKPSANSPRAIREILEAPGRDKTAKNAVAANHSANPKKTKLHTVSLDTL